MGTHSSQRVKTLIRGIINSGTLFVLHDLAVQEERGPRHVRSKISVTEGNSRVPFMCKSPQMNLPVFDSEILASNFSAKSIGRPDFILSSTPRISAGSTARYEIAAQIFLATLRAARRHREFSVLDLQEQNGILRRGWAAAFVLRAAIWPLDLTSFWKTDGVFIREGVQEVLAAARSAVCNLRLDRTEISVLETLALCRPEIAETTNSFSVTSRATDSALETLVRHLATRFTSLAERSRRLAKIMLVLPILTACCPRQLATDLFTPIIGHVDFEKVIASVR